MRNWPVLILNTGVGAGAVEGPARLVFLSEGGGK